MSLKLVASKVLSCLFLKKTNHFNEINKERTDFMSYPAIVEYLKKLAKFYFQSSKPEKSLLLRQASQMTGFHHKSILRHLHRNRTINENKIETRGRKELYPKELLLKHIEYLWNSMERISARRMKSALHDWLPFYHENEVTVQIKLLLQQMSVSTLERCLSQLRAKRRFKGVPSTISGLRLMKNKVPINTLDSKVKRPGYLQADTVAHCGDRLEGKFMNSLTVTDLASTWTENRALFTKKGHKVRSCIDSLHKSSPFPIIAINTDSGSEFLNIPVFNHFKRRRIIFTRSRPYKKNDNCYVEQKNYTHVRELFGYQRIDREELESVMNDIYINNWNPLQNFFLPTFKLQQKLRIGAKIKKTYGTPKTPYQRLIESPYLSEKQKTELFQRKKTLNPFKLKQGLEQKLDSFFKLLNRYENKRRAS